MPCILAHICIPATWEAYKSDPMWKKNNKVKNDRTLAQQAQGSDFKFQYCQKQKKKKKDEWKFFVLRKLNKIRRNKYNSQLLANVKLNFLFVVFVVRSTGAWTQGFTHRPLASFFCGYFGDGGITFCSGCPSLDHDLPILHFLCYLGRQPSTNAPKLWV
jgi:hypothetical protein